MDLEKLVALGEKMGLSGAELRKYVSQKEKEEREKAKEEKAAELERERLAVERAKEERAAELERERLAAERAKEEREAEMAEKERQRQHEIELERLQDPKIEPSSTPEPRREGAAEGNPVKDATRAQDEAEVRNKVNHEGIAPDEKTCRAGDVPTKRPPTTMSEKRRKSVAQTEHCVVPELAKHQLGTSERDDDPASVEYVNVGRDSFYDTFFGDGSQ
ncbi:hypothetical protein MTO96_049757 [Rhipicephalus appendiculatus]